MPDFLTFAASLSANLLGWFVETMVVASVFAVLAVLAGQFRWLAPGPAARHTLWLLVLIKLVTPPLIHWPWSIGSTVMIPRPVESSPRFVSTVELDPVARTEDIGDLTVVQTEESEATLSIVASESSVGLSAIPSRITPMGGIVAAWLVGSVGLVVLQSVRLARFGRRLRDSEPAPEWLIEEAEAVGRRLEVKVPPIRVVSHLSTPLVWCLGRPVLLVPSSLLKTLEAERWRAIVAHELAHLKRGDHWVRRLELVAGLGWWWCPLYCWVCRRIDFEAELACDAWAVWESPGDRLTYAESLIRIGTSLSPVDVPSPALGVAGTGHSFERRLTMILKDRVERRVSMSSLFLASALAALALPSWTSADEPAKPKVKSTFEVIVIDDATATVVLDDDELDDPKPEKPAKNPAKSAELEAKRKAIEAEIEAKIGPDSEFAKKMEALGKELEAKFGDSSEFAKKLELLGTEIEAKFGPDSDFIKDLVKGIEVKIVNDGEAAKAVKQKTDAKQARVEARVKAAKSKSDAEQVIEAQSKFLNARIDAEKRLLDYEARALKAKTDAEKLKLDEEFTAFLAKNKTELNELEARVKEAKEKRAAAEKGEVKIDKKIEVRLDGREKSKPENDKAKQARRIVAIESAIDQLQKELKAIKAETEKPEAPGRN